MSCTNAGFKWFFMRGGAIVLLFSDYLLSLPQNLHFITLHVLPLVPTEKVYSVFFRVKQLNSGLSRRHLMVLCLNFIVFFPQELQKDYLLLLLHLKNDVLVMPSWK